MPNNDSSQDGVVRSITILLAARGITRKDLAEALGKDQFWIGHRMNNRTLFKFGEVVEIASVFGLSVEEFLVWMLVMFGGCCSALDGIHETSSSGFD